MIKYYYRFVTKRVPINRFGKLGYKEYKEYFITSDRDFIAHANYRKRIKFVCDENVHDEDIQEYLSEGMKMNHIYETKCVE